MRILSFIPVLAAVVTIVVGAVVPRQRCDSEISCKRDSPAHDARDLTNAERLRRGLPLKSPILRRGTPARRADPSGRPAPDLSDPKKHGNKPNTIHHRGVIQVIDAATSAVLGYISKNSMKKAQFLHQPDIGSALVVTFKTDQTGSGTNLNLATTNSDTGFDFLGLVQGPTDDDPVLSSGSPEFVVLAAIASPGTTPGSKPTKLDSSYASAYETMKSAESAIWTFDASCGSLIPRWVNPDGSLPAVQAFTQSDDTINVTGDVNAFKNKYQSTPTVIEFKFIAS